MPDHSLHYLIRQARQCPALFLGSDAGTALPNSIRAPLNLVFETKAFTSPKKAMLNISPRQYHWVFETGPLRPEIANVIHWEEKDRLADAVTDSLEDVREMTGRWATPFQSNTNPFAWFSCNLWLAEAGVLAVRNSQGMWWQLYRGGWPVTPPTLEQGMEGKAGLVIAASLSEEWFPDLPFTLKAVEERIPEEFRPQIGISWRDQNTLFSDRSFDLFPAGFRVSQWLR